MTSGGSQPMYNSIGLYGGTGSLAKIKPEPFGNKGTGILDRKIRQRRFVSLIVCSTMARHNGAELDIKMVCHLCRHVVLSAMMKSHTLAYQATKIQFHLYNKLLAG